MTILTINEAATFLRLTKRTLYQRTDIPRVRYGHRVMFVKEELENWIRELSGGSIVIGADQAAISQPAVDGHSSKVYHRSPLFRLDRST